MTKEKDIRYLPSYGIPEAAHYLRVPVSTLRAWVCGQLNFKPLIVLPEYLLPLLSFVNLVEAYVLASIRRKYAIPMPKVRNALKYVGKPTFSSESEHFEKSLLHWQ